VIKKQGTKKPHRKSAAKKTLKNRKTTPGAGKPKRTQTTIREKSSAQNIKPARNTQRNSNAAKSKKRKRVRSSKEKKAYYLRQGVQQAVYVITIFMVLFVLSLSFLLYQWKDYTLVEYGKEIQRYKADILYLESEVNRNKAQINSELIKYHRIAQISGDKLGLKPSVQEPIPFKVDKNIFEHYVEKDRKAEQ
jgi:hypothetical protein